jgi:hypothetical protein
LFARAVEIEDVGNQGNAQCGGPIMVRVSTEAQTLIKALRAGHRCACVKPDPMQSSGSRLLDAGTHEGLTDASTADLRRHAKHPNRRGIGIFYFAQTRLAESERDAANDLSLEFRNEHLASPDSRLHVAKLLFIRLIANVSECPIRLNDQLTCNVVLPRQHGPNDRFPHDTTLTGLRVSWRSAGVTPAGQVTGLDRD